MFQLLFSMKFIRLVLVPKFILQSTVFILSVFLLSCGSNNTDAANSSDSSGTTMNLMSSAQAAKAPISSELNILYLENFANKNGEPPHEQLKKLLTGSNKQKLLFNFFIDKGGIMRLTSYPSTDNHRTVSRDTVQPFVSEVNGDSIPADGQVFFGTMQLDRAVLRELRAHMYAPPRPGQDPVNKGWEYIWFEPEYMDVSSEPDYRHIIYNIKRSNSKPEAATLTNIAAVSIGYAKPSPPYGIN